MMGSISLNKNTHSFGYVVKILKPDVSVQTLPVCHTLYHLESLVKKLSKFASVLIADSLVTFSHANIMGTGFRKSKRASIFGASGSFKNFVN